MESNLQPYLVEIIKALKPLKSLDDPLIQQPEFVGAMVGAAAAMFIAIYGEWFRKLWHKTDLVVEGTRSNEQGSGATVHYRISIVNRGNYQAREVEAYVDKIYDDGVERQNFLPVPLNWTHASKYMSPGVYRNIHPNQHVLLDFCEHTKDRNLLKLRLVQGGEVEDFCIINHSNTKVVLKLYQENGKTVIIKLLIEWNAGSEPRITVIN